MFDLIAMLSCILIVYLILRDISQRYTAEQILTGYCVITTVLSMTLMLCPRWLRWMLVGCGLSLLFV